MSQSQVPFVKYIDPRLNLNQRKQYSSAESASLITTSFKPVNGEVGTDVNVNCNPPNRNICISREVIKRATFSMTVDVKNTSGADKKANQLFNYTIGPSYMPLSRITLNEDMTIGNANVNQSNAYIVRETLSRFCEDKYNSSSANMNDTYLTFSQVENSVRSALAPYYDGQTQFGEMVSRPSLYSFDYKCEEIKDTETKTATITFTVEEPLMLSPFVFGKDAEKAMALIGIESMNYSASFGKLNQILNTVSVDAVTYSNLSNIRIESFGLRFKYLTPQPDYDIPRNALYPYYEPQIRSQTSQTLNAGETSGLQSLSIQLSGIPRRMYFCFRDDDATGTKPLRHLELVDGTFGIRINGQNTLQGQSNKQLYDMSRKNGYNLSYSQWTKYCGSIVCVDFGCGDASLNVLQVAGVNQKNEFEVFCEFKNQTGETFTGRFVVIYIYDGVFRMANGATNKLINTVQEQDVKNTKSQQSIPIDNTPDNVYGGGIFSGLNFEGLKSAGKSVAKNLYDCAVEKEILDKAYKAYGKKGSGLEPAGGRLMSREMLKNRY